MNQIPGMQIVQNYSVQNSNSAPEPVYHLPLGHPDIKAVIDSSAITRSTTTQLQVNGAGLVVYLQAIYIAPGSYRTFKLPLSGSSAQSATFQYLTPSTPQLPVQINGPSGPVGRVPVPSHR